VLSCALLRAAAVPSRVRCGFATYLQPGLAVDHWIAEYWPRDQRRWVRVDSEILGLGVVPRPHDLDPGMFLAGPEAWRQYRDGADPMAFGVHGTQHAWGVAEIIGNAIPDLACLQRIEMLPWDEWGPMADCYRGNVGQDAELLMDRLSDAIADDDSAELDELYTEVPVPESMMVEPARFS